MAFVYPEKPWTDGQTITKTIHGMEVVIAKYDASKNLWTHLGVNDAGEFVYVTACKVKMDWSCVDPCLPNISWENIDNLATALQYLHYWLFDPVNGAIPRIEKLENG